ncbi:hypothetical protein BD626DRAFT_506106 [Schizophyllum amplum]|uniref:Thioesterase domain-containing protein n=1 Tax=Schizophyllum amplum TaxID=97359 RepID=A0A550C5B8_9AGAR|nr:hypothetical protein BD626DRAFT_506106 [Auriculariopsis ampla]
MAPPARRTPPSESYGDDRTSTRHPPNALAAIQGNASCALKDGTLTMLALFGSQNNGFSNSVRDQVRITEVSVTRGESGKSQAQVVCELEVCKDMLNIVDSMHGGCTVFLIDEISTLAVNALEMHVYQAMPTTIMNVSQAINTVYHAPAPFGTTLRVVGSCISVDENSALFCRAEIWDINNQRMVATGTHIKMPPSQPKSRL